MRETAQLLNFGNMDQQSIDSRLKSFTSSNIKDEDLEKMLQVNSPFRAGAFSGLQSPTEHRELFYNQL